MVLHDINLVLSTIPASNNVTNLFFDISIAGKQPFDGCFKEDWIGLWDEVVRISAGKPLELNLKATVLPYNFQYLARAQGQDELFERMTERIVALISNYPNIDTHFLANESLY
jgi:hypothetical protein